MAEADVVVRIEDTAFVIECKSRRATKTDTCVTFEDASARVRAVGAWAAQVRRTAEFFAQHPVGPIHAVPTDIRWIVPIVCSEGLEIDWLQPESAYLVPREVSIFMRADELVQFLLSTQWRAAESRAYQYRVRR
ncbi:hypothetical protein [Agromyces sp. NPDC058126]|uniref:hypothetical protein n=1 Tax=Agromyces sp. NPDC058126 TaxID=3346350 RepID=UPI0036D84933